MTRVEIQRVDEQTVAVSGLSLLLCELLQQIPVAAADDSDEAQARLFSTPTHGADPECDEEWKSYVEPGLRELFESALDVVQADLENFPPDEPAETHTLHLPVKNLESWIHALNQARLALFARYDVTEPEMEELPTSGDERALAIFQIHFYGFLEECFLREVDR